jgi:hypothetical protein
MKTVINNTINAYILEAINVTDYNVIATTEQEKLQFVADCFNSEYNHEYNKKRYPNYSKQVCGMVARFTQLL